MTDEQQQPRPNVFYDHLIYMFEILDEDMQKLAAGSVEPTPSRPLTPAEHNERFQRAVEQLNADLEEGLSLFNEGGQRGDGGREGIKKSLIGVVDFVGTGVQPGRSDLLKPLIELVLALIDLERGKVHEALIHHRAGPGRPKDSLRAWELKARSLVASQILQMKGKLAKVANADVQRRIAESARILGVGINENSLKDWQSDLNLEHRRMRREKPDDEELFKRQYPLSFHVYGIQFQCLAKFTENSRPDDDTLLAAVLGPIMPDSLVHFSSKEPKPPNSSSAIPLLK